MIEVLTGSTLNTIQDFGRAHAMTLGVARGGAMDRLALACGNILLGNAPDAAGIEIVFFPFRVRFHTATTFAVTGAECPATLDGQALPKDWATTAQPGQVLALQAPAQGARCYLALGGGIDVPPVLGARATDLKGGFGGLDGRALRKGDRLACVPALASPLPHSGYGLSRRCPLPSSDGTTVRVLPAAEYDVFTTAAQTLFHGQAWRLTPSANRMGYRLEGETTLALTRPLNLFSHGIVPGTVQVPPAGQPIIQMTDANTCGGYPKIATVIEPDLRLLAQTPVGTFIRFIAITREEAVDAIRAETRAVQVLARDVARLRTSLTA
ncbi:biotin-dependent carboxyltransferase [Gluconacetobacter azotocaptans]|uniref:Biotin-dependent carboxyltransferase n=1 Tax=Gluconacetobacter azotocaptans TaxID=142834 RepID=A0A7W4JSU6_9PROT|nr:biotin-dependent carboxyltransferase family protein [Gluconacetobacter azotocaptans]MBB2190278.1 biotin-dependent carboxyltransferase [Gluconacetobacter azotocaptans]GBQ27365.1 allophanate hydrolase subunit 2 [Gluconacetobacter azotocaptans DSM 13594]